MALPTQLNATEQDTLVKQIGLSLLRAAPRDWRRFVAEYRAVGRYHELTGHVVTADGETQDWAPTHDIATLFGKLRAGMYRDGRGTWFNARYQLDHPSSYNLEYDREEPEWDLAPPPQAYADELRMYPRSEDNVPDWLMRRMSGLGPERPGPRFRMARIFDGAGPNGRPLINRPEIANDEHDRLLDYLDGAPVVVPGRGYDIDRLAITPESTVPIAFHSDGVWIWPAAVNYYLREYGVAPEPDLVEHIRAAEFTVPEVPEPVRQAAASHISRGGTPQQRSPAPEVDGEPEPEAVREPEPKTASPPGTPHERADQAPSLGGQFALHGAERTQVARPGAFEERTRLNEPAERNGQGLFEERSQYEERLERNGVDQRSEPTMFTEPPGPDELASDASHADPAPGEGTEPGHLGHLGQLGRTEELDQLDEIEQADQPERADPAEQAEPTEQAEQANPSESDQTPDADDTTTLDQVTEPEETAESDEREELGEPGRLSSEERFDQRSEQDEPTTVAALSALSAGSTVNIAAAGPPTPNKHAAPVEAEADVDMNEAPTAEQETAQPLPPSPGPPVALESAASDDASQPTRHAVTRPEGPAPVPGAPGPAASPSVALTTLRRKLEDAGVPDSSYRIGEPAERGWSIEEVPDGWRVGWYDGELQNPTVFHDAEDAAAYMLGKVLLQNNAGDPPRAAAPASRPEPPAVPAPPVGPPPAAASPLPKRAPNGPGAPALPPRRAVGASLTPDAAPGARPAPREEPSPRTAAVMPAAAGAPREAPPREAPPREAPAAAPPRREREGRPPAERQDQRQRSGQQWPIQPMPGEPPLTLFRGKELRELPVGSELDRFGGPNGNLTYAAGTPFEERSLVPEWVSRPYHVYRVQRPLEALAGVAIPWFNQPGGGAAYLLPASIDELLADGDLIELEPGEPPVD